MTVKTVQQGSDISVKTSTRSDMQKRGAVRNLFNTTVDREELQSLSEQLENKSLKTLRSYKCEAVIGEIFIESDDQDRKHKRCPRRDSEEDLEVDGEPLRLTRRSGTDCNVNMPSTSDVPTQRSATSKLSEINLISQSSLPLPKGQRTLDEYYPIIKRKKNR